MLGRRLHAGNNWSAGEVGHMVIWPQGRICYCGKKGCSDAYLNTGVLLREEEEGREEGLEAFFRRLGDKDPDAMAVWDTYLDNLAILCSNLRMVLDLDIILGGEVGAWMDPWIEELSIRMESLDLFSRDVDYLSACRCKKHIFPIGAALSAMDRFDESMLADETD